jgi:hypothetical protein
MAGKLLSFAKERLGEVMWKPEKIPTTLNNYV